MKTTSTTSMIEVLTAVWQRVLQLSTVGADDNFFELGGDSAQSLELFNEIALVCGRELPPVMIYHAPTISALAALLEQSALPRVPPLVQLKAGLEETPIFIAHGLGGSALDFFQLVKHIQTPHAIHGLQAKGIDGVDEPLGSIGEMAQYWLAAIKQVQPHGPYQLIGFSLGGLVTLEMAQQLIATGEKVGLLAMLDSYPHVSRLSKGQRARLSIRQTWRRIAARLQWLGVPAPYQTVVDVPSSPSVQRARDASYLALERYKPQFYPGKINFVRAAIATDFPADAAAVWSHLACEFELQTVPGDHVGIMTTHFEGLGSVISGFLRNATA